MFLSVQVPDRCAACRTRFWVILPALCLSLLSYIGSHASARSLPRIEATGNAVVVNRQVALRFTAPYGRSLPGVRARAVADRLMIEALRGLAPHAIQPDRAGKQWRVVIAGRTPLLQVTPQDSHAHGSHPKALAYRWASQIRRALAIPPVAIHPARLVVPLGETRVLKLDGYAEGTPSAWIEQNAPALQLVHPPGARHLMVRAETPGKAVVRVRVGKNEATCVVEARKWAGQVPLDLTAEVTGVPEAPADLVLHAANAVLRHAPREPGATLQVVTPLQAIHPLPAGQSRTLTARVTLKGPGYLPTSGLARVRVINRELPYRPATRLFYSNNPEHITRHTTLYTATLTDDAPARVMFHHDNQMSGTVLLAVSIANLSDQEVRLHVTPGFVAQDRNPVKVGFLAGRAFLNNALRQRGEIWRLPARTAMPLFLQRLAPGETGSGLAQIRMINPPADVRCRVLVEALSPVHTGFASAAQNRLDPWRYTRPRPLSRTQLAALPPGPGAETTYRPRRQMEAQYVVGERWAFVPIGLPEASTSDTDHAEIAGDYGVLYDIRVTVRNPHPYPQVVTFEFAPGGGPAMAVFTVAGHCIAIPEVRPPHHRPITRITLRPHEKRVIPVQTVPLGGSSYPAKLIIR
ncbi:MAG: hypothetical protein RMJ43_16355 [Chloroherpetonaceae bacterium]|nr:hypothetical protein [Chthonomonadaceae bacterium]MDW8209406.1 hypothetical protein [Chloroherpetonaceae bacterium]